MRLFKFAGMTPGVESRYKSAEDAEYCKNTRLWDGTIRAFRRPSGSVEFTDPCTVGDYTIKNGRVEHLDGTPIYVEPIGTPIVSIDNPGEDAVQFMVAAVNQRGNESRRSVPTGLMYVGVDSVINVTASGTYRLYATAGDTLDGSLENEFNDSDNLYYLGEFTGDVSIPWEPYQSPDYDMNDMTYPKDAVCMLTDEEGYTIVFGGEEGKNVWLSVRHRPDLYPILQTAALRHKIRQVIPHIDAFFALTDGYPEIIRKPMHTDGTYAGQLNVQPLRYHTPLPYMGPGVRTEFGCVYPSKPGLIALTTTIPGGIRMVTQNILVREWKDYIPTVTAWFNGVFYGWNAKKALILDMNDEQFGQYGVRQMVEIDPGVTQAEVTSDGDLQVPSGVWDTGSFLSAEWKSKWNVSNGFRIYTCAKVCGENTAGVVYELWGKTAGLIHREVIKNDKPFRMKPVREIEHQVRLYIPASGSEVVITECHTEVDLNSLTKHQ